MKIRDTPMPDRFLRLVGHSAQGPGVHGLMMEEGVYSHVNAIVETVLTIESSVNLGCMIPYVIFFWERFPNSMSAKRIEQPPHTAGRQLEGKFTIRPKE
jgi:hypothetical protein